VLTSCGACQWLFLRKIPSERACAAAAKNWLKSSQAAKSAAQTFSMVHFELGPLHFSHCSNPVQ
jgi:hypothetical protein